MEEDFINLTINTDTEISENTYTLISEEQSEEGNSLLMGTKKIRDINSTKNQFTKKYKSFEINNSIESTPFNKNYSDTEIETFRKSPRIQELITIDKKSESKIKYIWKKQNKRIKLGTNFKTMFVRKKTRKI